MTTLKKLYFLLITLVFIFQNNSSAQQLKIALKQNQFHPGQIIQLDIMINQEPPQGTWVGMFSKAEADKGNHDNYITYRSVKGSENYTATWTAPNVGKYEFILISESEVKSRAAFEVVPLPADEINLQIVSSEMIPEEKFKVKITSGVELHRECRIGVYHYSPTKSTAQDGYLSSSFYYYRNEENILSFKVPEKQGCYEIRFHGRKSSIFLKRLVFAVGKCDLPEAELENSEDNEEIVNNSEEEKGCEKNEIKYLKNQAVTFTYYFPHSEHKPFFAQKPSFERPLPPRAWALMSSAIVQSLNVGKNSYAVYSAPSQFRKGNYITKTLEGIGWAISEQVVAAEVNPRGTDFTDISSVATFYLSALSAAANGLSGVGSMMNNSQQDVYWEVQHESVTITCWPMMRCVNGKFEPIYDKLHVAKTSRNEGTQTGNRKNLTPNQVKAEYEHYLKSLSKIRGWFEIDKELACENCIEKLEKVKWPVEGKWCTFYKNREQVNTDSLNQAKAARNTAMKEYGNWVDRGRDARLKEIQREYNALSKSMDPINNAIKANQSEIEKIEKRIQTFTVADLKAPQHLYDKIKLLEEKNIKLTGELLNITVKKDLLAEEENALINKVKSNELDAKQKKSIAEVERFQSKLREIRPLIKKYCK